MKTKLTLLMLALVSSQAFATRLESSAGPFDVNDTSGWSAAPTVIIAHGCGGLDAPRHIRDWVQTIRDAGFNAVVMDSFTARGYPKGVCGVNSVTPTQRSQDVAVTSEWIRKQRWHTGKVAIIGFSHGGATTLNVASTPNSSVDAAVAIYPNCWKTFVGRDWSVPTIPTQIHVAENDAWTNPLACQHNVTTQQVFSYPGAGHSYDINYPDRVIAGYFLSYNKAASDLTHVRTQIFLKQQLGQ